MAGFILDWAGARAAGVSRAGGKGWQLAVLGIACVTTDAGQADRVLADAVRVVRNRAAEAELIDYQTEIVYAL